METKEMVIKLLNKCTMNPLTGEEHEPMTFEELRSKVISYGDYILNDNDSLMVVVNTDENKIYWEKLLAEKDLKNIGKNVYVIKLKELTE